MNDPASTVGCAVEGLGLAYVFESIAHDALSAGKLKRVLPAATPASRACTSTSPAGTSYP